MNHFTHPLFEQIYYYPKLRSTGLIAANLMRKKEVNGNFLVIANEQTGGYGRKGNFWYSPQGGLWFTMGLYGFYVSSNFTLHTGIILHKTILELFPELEKHLKIKWPNDLISNGKKVVGLITEHFPRRKYHLIGIGLNLNIDEIPSEIASIATSIKIETGIELDGELVLTTFLNNFTDSIPEFIENGFSINYFRKYDLLLHKKIKLDAGFSIYEGICIGVNKEGAILLKFDNGMIQPFFSGTIL